MSTRRLAIVLGFLCGVAIGCGQDGNLEALLAGGALNAGALVCDTASSCGDGVVDSGEGCDDGNRVPGDGCSARCTTESGWSCTGGPSVCANGCTAVANADIELDRNTRYQTISGWEATAQAGQAPLLNSGYALYRDELMDRAVNELGINRLRLEVKSGVEHTNDNWADLQQGTLAANWNDVRYDTVNDNGDPNVLNMAGFQWDEFDHDIENVVLPLRERLTARGECLHLNVIYTNFDDPARDPHSPAEHDHDAPGEYGEFVLATFLHLRDAWGLVPDTWEVILEPDNTATWDDGRVIGEDIVEAANRLAAEGFPTRFVAPSAADMFDAWDYFDDAIQVPGVLPVLKELSYHRYQSASVTNLTRIRDRILANGIQSAMLEWIRAGYVQLHQDLEVARVSAFQQFALAFPSPNPQNGAQYYWVDDSNPAAPTLTLEDRAKVLRQYFRYIRAGAVRLGATSGTATFEPLAFVNPDGGHVVVVKANGAGTFDVGGLPPGTYGIKYSTADPANGRVRTYDVDQPNVAVGCGETVRATIPDTGVLTIYAR